jgi:hypothetical protein
VVAYGLEVSAYSLSNPERRIESVVTPSGVFVFRGLSGLATEEFGAGDAAYWNAVTSRPMIVEVADSESRFLPFLFDTTAPFKGLTQLLCWSPPSPPDSTVGVPLFSAPARPVPGGNAVIRAHLWDAQADIPASWALVEAHSNGRVLGRGIADERGQLVLIFTVPELEDKLPTSPLSMGESLKEQTWTIELRVFYAYWGTPPPVIPDLCKVLNQPPTRVWARRSPNVPLGMVELEYGKELIVKSQARSELLIAP